MGSPQTGRPHLAHQEAQRISSEACWEGQGGPAREERSGGWALGLVLGEQWAFWSSGAAAALAQGLMGAVGRPQRWSWGLLGAVGRLQQWPGAFWEQCGGLSGGPGPSGHVASMAPVVTSLGACRGGAHVQGCAGGEVTRVWGALLAMSGKP